MCLRCPGNDAMINMTEHATHEVLDEVTNNADISCVILSYVTFYEGFPEIKRFNFGTIYYYSFLIYDIFYEEGYWLKHLKPLKVFDNPGDYLEYMKDKPTLSDGYAFLANLIV